VDADFIRELFSGFRPVDVRRMFSGAGIFCDGRMFGLVVDDVIYLKVGDLNEPDFEREKLPPFQYKARSGKRVVMSYRRMPERLYDDPEELSQWARKSLQAAQEKAAPKRGRIAAKKTKSKR
jgi:DNA transformation protein